MRSQAVKFSSQDAPISTELPLPTNITYIILLAAVSLATPQPLYPVKVSVEQKDAPAKPYSGPSHQYSPWMVGLH